MKAIELCASVAVFVGPAMLIAACGWVIDPDVLVARSTDDADVTGIDGDADVIGIDGGGRKPNCTPTGAEICDDGIDNDCNGEVDCSDSVCAEGFECLDPAPAGWDPILLADNGRPTCPAGYTGSTDVRVVRGDGAITCACSCGGGCDPTITLTEGTEPTCTVTPTTATFQANTTKCTGKGFDLSSGFTKATAGSGTCSANDAPIKSELTDGRTCTPPQRAGAGCEGARRCMPKTTGFATCVAKAGVSVCPATLFTKQRRSGTTANDQRACAGCACNSTPCDVELELWSHPVCQGSAGLKITNSCAANGSISNVKAYKSTVTGGCAQATPSTPQGAIVFENEQTICCRE
jgi:ferredoxin-like protein FixX